MDLIYTDKSRTDIGVLKDYKYDLAYGSGENDFELTVSIDNNVCEEDYYLYIENTEYGGRIDSIDVDTANRTIKYKGRTFHGIIDKKVITPDSGSNYYVIGGDLNVALDTLIKRLHLDSLFKASTELTGVRIGYQFPRYITGYKGITKMLADYGYKLRMLYKDGYVELSAVKAVIYDEDTGLDSDRINFQIQKTYNPVNHLICLGQGELSQRMVRHLYLDQNGNITTTQYYTGIEEITEVFDYSNAESEDELIKQGEQKLREQDTNSINLNLGNGYEFDIGDMLTVTDVITGITVSRRITKKIVTINKDVLKINYSVGE